MRPERPREWGEALIPTHPGRGLRLGGHLLTGAHAAEDLDLLAHGLPQAHLAQLRLAVAALHVHAGHLGAAHHAARGHEEPFAG